MASEIERKFRVTAEWRPRDAGTLIVQGYLSSVPERVVRVRRAGDTAKLTVKGKTTGITRAEFEYEIPVADVDALLALCEVPLIEKRRHVEEHGGKRWEIDEFLGVNAGLVVAELELASAEEAYERPPWLGEEVSDDPRYYNNNLIARPFSTW
jgi:adenylate cyclase